MDLREDPVLEKLREIDRVDMLSMDQELWLSTRIRAENTVRMLKSGRASRRRPNETTIAVHQVLYDDLRTSWRRVLKDTKGLSQPEPDLQCVLDEAMGLRHSWIAGTTSYLWEWLFSEMRVTNPALEQLARNLISVLVSLYIFPEEILSRLKQRLKEGKRLPNSLAFKRWLQTVDDLPSEFDRIAQRAEEAQTALIRTNMRMVASIAKRYRGQGIAFVDLIQEGNIGLLAAVEEFDPATGYRFSTYANWWIREAIRSAVNRKRFSSRTVSE